LETANKKTDIWMPLSIGDYLADTSHLSTLEHGAYLLILMHYWRKGPLPNDLAKIAQIAKLGSDAWSIPQALLSEFFFLAEDGMYHQKRADREIEKWQGKRQSAQEKAAKAAKARWNKDAPSIPSSNAQSNAQAMLGSCPLPLPLSKNKYSRSTLEEIYQAYPKHVGKEAAFKAIEKALKRIPQSSDWLLERVHAYAETRRREDAQFTPHPSTWFNEGRYEDETLEPKQKEIWVDAATGEQVQ
jgi:uncharacterized protein YdaU (DUF1376 family)